MNELQAGIEPSFAVFSQSSVLFQSSEGAFDHPAFWDYSEGVESITLDDLDGSIQGLRYQQRVDLPKCKVWEAIGSQYEKLI